MICLEKANTFFKDILITSFELILFCQYYILLLQIKFEL